MVGSKRLTFNTRCFLRLANKLAPPDATPLQGQNTLGAWTRAPGGDDHSRSGQNFTDRFYESPWTAPKSPWTAPKSPSQRLDPASAFASTAGTRPTRDINEQTSTSNRSSRGTPVEITGKGLWQAAPPPASQWYTLSYPPVVWDVAPKEDASLDCVLELGTSLSGDPEARKSKSKRRRLMDDGTKVAKVRSVGACWRCKLQKATVRGHPVTR